MQADRVDQSALGFDYQSKMEKHESQKGQQTDRKATGRQTDGQRGRQRGRHGEADKNHPISKNG